ncbi:hypothetical protein SAMN05428978_10963 [Nitrosomonas sp. Nm34]|nr:hypothetical protein SAMN05428978_10963 [Nitrosomonas sp. Nm34]
MFCYFLYKTETSIFYYLLMLRRPPKKAYHLGHEKRKA